ncbi:hypothetical protein KSAC_31410 (plasmid) [Komagataeibacter saccharivorans]|uniref:hypothetical protein n=1 Tax=Komagataeibacter saccharivorans TaxID=265959 RepID=UPI0010506D34|nr:hypothetical protein [Komagataeibacter saccharivorans]QBL95320.1 hypothetical protein KSAC_31410 [Komagataeibacter saccharivorans]
MSAPSPNRRPIFCTLYHVLGALWHGVAAYFACLVVLFGICGVVADFVIRGVDLRADILLPLTYWLRGHTGLALFEAAEDNLIRLDTIIHALALGSAFAVATYQLLRRDQATTQRKLRPRWRVPG